MKTDLFVWGRPDKGVMVNRLSRFAAGLWTAQGRWKRRGGCSDRPIHHHIESLWQFGH